MRATLRITLTACLILFIVLFALKSLIEDKWDQYGVGSFIEHKVKSTFRDGTVDYLPSSAGATGDKVVVMARLEKDDTNWVAEKLSDWQAALYTVDPSPSSHPQLTTPSNKGHEAMAYLTYIIDNYGALPSILAFLHSHLSAWHTDTPLHSNVDALRMLKLEYVEQNGYVNLRCNHNPGCLEAHTHNAHVTPAVYEEVFRGTSTEFNRTGHRVQPPDRVGASCCAQFAVSRDQVLKRPLGDYERFREWILHTKETDAKSGRVMEFLWHVIFGRDPV
ncbi:MAG: hypothetical protein Q9163_006385 [Psora crenata]